MSHQHLLEAAAKEGFYIKRIATGGRPATRWACKCAKCDKEQVWGWDAGTSPEFMIKNLRREKWTHDKRGPICDTCTNDEKSEKRVSKLEPLSNPKLQRKVFALLNDHFDEERRLYKSGWSDKKIAEAADTSEHYVASVRCEAYGELAEDPAITAMKAEIDALASEAKTVADEMMERMGQIEAKITQLYTRLDGYALKHAV